ncbi:MAG: hypothetical protein ACYDC3_14755 [Candidatus Binataceae bacterium]
MQCTNGPAPHFYTQKLGNRWWICDPAGNGFFLKGVYDAVMENNNAQTSFITSKYSSGLTPSSTYNWALEQARRLQTWGFNTFAEYAINAVWPANIDPQWGTSDSAIPVKLPFSIPEMTTHYAFINGAGCGMSSPLKDIMNGVGPVYTGYRYGFGDYFDPGYANCVANELANDTWGLQLALKSKYSNYVVYVIIDESDEMGPLDNGPDFGEVGNNGQVGSPGGGAAHTSWITLVTAPTQTSNSSQGVTYPNTTVYTKQELSTWLSTRYSGSITALNTAWGSSYTTFGASGAGWGIGSGILDENGTCPSKQSGQNCWVGDPFTLGASAAFPTAETAAMQADMSAFYVHYLDQYFSVTTNAFHTAAPGYLLQVQLGSWSAPARKEALAEAAKYIDLPLVTVPSQICTDCTDLQARIDFTAQNLGDLPWITFEGFWAQPDSAESAYATGNPGTYATQAARGAGYQSMMSGLINAKDSATGTYHLVGFDWWGLYDMNSQQDNWGLLTPHDDPYDGTSATIAGNGKDQWGYPTGGEADDYGDFIDDVTTANNAVYSALSP